jgi:hypothetical protein
MTTHVVKSWAHFFDAIDAGLKTHDLRKNDRDYKVGDRMLLLRYDNIEGKHTGHNCLVEITYITDNVTPCAFSSAVLEKGYSILSIRKIPIGEYRQ